NLRPATCLPALAEASTLREEVVSGLDIMIVRELTAGVYFGQPRGMQTYEGQERCIDTQSYTKAEIERVTEVAFDLARKRNKLVHSVEKANVMESGIFWRGVVSDMHKNGGYSDIELQHMYADNCAMQLVRNPKQFDVIVTDNLFGDILSDCAAMLTGSLGMLPSASLGAKDANGKAKALYEPVHGSAPDIAGQGMANPLASILSFAMCLRYSFDMGAEADLIENAAQAVLNGGIRTADIMQKGKAKVSTSVMGDSLLREMDKLA
ncbi:MAG: 3-isopropylmalate dehydrogenase, partial [Alphaproteobacteria bacterium]|nr:3-isopropylmalate dehydrogenase [Alphaproteobacteria bacterium]